MKEFVYQLKKTALNSLGHVRCIEGLHAAADEDSIWIRGINEMNATDVRLRQLPIQQSFSIDGNNLLFAAGSVTPVAEMKEMEWQTMQNFVAVELPVSAMPCKINPAINIQLIASHMIREGAALLTDIATWKNYAETAAAVRLQRLRFAVSEKNEVLVIGHPLPALPGKEYWLNNGILLPSGYDFEIAIAAIFIRKKLNSDNNAVIVFDTEGNWQKIENIFFVPAKRSAVRLTKENQVC